MIPSRLLAAALAVVLAFAPAAEGWAAGSRCLAPISLPTLPTLPNQVPSAAVAPAMPQPLLERLAEQGGRLEILTGPQGRALPAESSREEARSAFELESPLSGVPLPPEDPGRAKRILHQGALKRVIAVSAVFTAIEAAGSVATGSVSLQADAMHLAADLAINIGALAAILGKPYGYVKLEPIIGLGSAVLIAALGLYTGVEAWQRFQHPAVVSGLQTLVLACAGLAANVWSTLLLYRYREDSLSLKGAFLHTVTDAVGSVGIIVGGLLIAAFGWSWTDPVISVMIVGLILKTTGSLAMSSWGMLRHSP